MFDSPSLQTLFRRQPGDDTIFKFLGSHIDVFSRPRGPGSRSDAEVAWHVVLQLLGQQLTSLVAATTALDAAPSASLAASTCRLVRQQLGVEDWTQVLAAAEVLVATDQWREDLLLPFRARVSGPPMVSLRKLKEGEGKRVPGLFFYLNSLSYFFVAYFLCFKQMQPLKCKKITRLKLQVEGLQGRFNLGPCTSESLGHLGLSHGREPWQGAARRSVRPWSEGSREAEPSALLVMAWSQLVLRLGGLSGVDGLA